MINRELAVPNPIQEFPRSVGGWQPPRGPRPTIYQFLKPHEIEKKLVLRGWVCGRPPKFDTD